jgi:hypothetical protein
LPGFARKINLNGRAALFRKLLEASGNFEGGDAVFKLQLAKTIIHLQASFVQAAREAS